MWLCCRIVLIGCLVVSKLIAHSVHVNIAVSSLLDFFLLNNFILHFSRIYYHNAFYYSDDYIFIRFSDERSSFSSLCNFFYGSWNWNWWCFSSSHVSIRLFDVWVTHALDWHLPRMSQSFHWNSFLHRFTCRLFILNLLIY